MSNTMRILVIDDLATMRRLIKSQLHDLGYVDVTEAEDAKAVLPMLENACFEFLIVDWDMPGVASLGLLAAIRADVRFAKLPVLMLTADTMQEQIIEAMRAGVSGYVTKPFMAATLKEKIEKILASKAAA
jgi:two-component system chemotaxis response regulator CheY